ncbi:MAG TPA: T9SS type A sorting domain-containing protein [Saprospiraceae bacterium]|nr:T9SS type A sorting domain-containing protein [Saprospiraceae bacterium]
MQTNVQKSFPFLFFLFFSGFAAFTQTPTLVKDINNVLVSANPRNMANMNGTIFFSADDGLHGRELWKTTGTDASTVMIKDIHPSGSSNPGNFCLLNGTIFFTATSPFFGTELWKTDGTAEGTVQVKDLAAGLESSEPAQLTAFGGKVFFSALRITHTAAGVIAENKLFSSDGTEAGTGVFEVANAPLLAPSNFTAVGNNLFFSATSGTMGNELWKTNGVATAAGTQVISNVLTPAQNVGSTPRNLVNIGGNLFLSLNNVTHGRQVWKFTPAGNTLTRLTSVQTMGVAGTEVSQIASVGSTVFFSTATGNSVFGNQLRKLNSAAADGTFSFANGTNVSSLTVVGNTLFFAQSPALVDAPMLSRVGANDATISIVKTFSLIPNGEYPVPQNLINVNGTLFFTAARAAEGRELWKATTAGATFIQDFVSGAAGANISDLCARGSTLFFASDGFGSAIGGNELRSSDGTVNAIVTVKNIGRAGSFPREFVRMGSFTYFTADDSDAGRELWRTSAAGTQRVADIIAGTIGSNPSDLIVVTNTDGIQTLFFEAKDPAKGRELFKLENTANALPVCISDIIAGSGSSGIGNLTSVNGTLHFTASQGQLGLGDRIFKVNTTRTGVITTGGGMTFADNLVAMGGTLFFTQSPQVGDRRLDKLVNGATVSVKTFVFPAGAEDPIPQQLTVIGARLFFTAGDGPLSRRIWVTNVAASSATVVANFNPSDLTNFNGRLVFTAPSINIAGHRTIIRINTALNGTENLYTGPSITNLQPAGTTLFFFEASVGGMMILSKITSTNNTVVSLGEFPDGNTGVALQSVVAGNKLFFTMNHADSGIELWKSAGVANDATLVSDIRPGVGNANIEQLRMCGTDLFFSANDLTAGQEPWKLAAAAAFQDGSDERSSALEAVSDMPVAVIPPVIRVYPNPATDYVNVDLPGNEVTGTLTLVSASGQTLRSVHSSEGETNVRLDIQDLPRGMYLVRWEQTDGQVAVKKVVVQ